MSTAEQIARGFRRAGERLQTTETITRVVLTVERFVKPETPIKRGTLRRSITGRVISPTRGVVGTNLAYARPVHDGRRAVRIVPVNKRVLFWKGARHPVRSVTQPARPGNPFMTRGLARSLPTVNGELRAVGIAALGDVGK